MVPQKWFLQIEEERRTMPDLTSEQLFLLIFFFASLLASSASFLTTS
jgi:hypothetical protein